MTQISPAFYAILLSFLFTVGSNHEAYRQKSTDEAIKTLLTNFLDSISYPQIHQKFWADDLIYTSSAEKRFGKESIVSDMNMPTPEQLANAPRYSAEDVTIRVFDKTAILTFALISDQRDTHNEYLNSGTLIKRNGRWQVVCRQATIKED